MLIHNILLILGIFIMCSIFTFTAITFRRSRLPRKRQEMERLQRIIGDETQSKDSLSQFDHILQAEYKGTDYILPVFFVTLFCALGLYVLFSGKDPLILTGVFTQKAEGFELARLSYKKMSLVSIGMAILGSYIWSIQYIVRRAMNFDLVPGAYYNIGTRIILASFVSVILHHYIESLDPTMRKEMLDVLPVLAFLVGFFPQRVLQYLQEKVFFFSRSDKLAHKMPLEMIEGINLFSRVRLAEVGIDNAQNLAEANIKELILKTPFNPQLLLDWIAQAKLYIIAKNNIEDLRKASVRTIFDLITTAENDKLTNVAELSKLDEKQLATICEIVKKDPRYAMLHEIRHKLSNL